MLNHDFSPEAARAQQQQLLDASAAILAECESESATSRRARSAKSAPPPTASKSSPRPFGHTRPPPLTSRLAGKPGPPKSAGTAFRRAGEPVGTAGRFFPERPEPVEGVAAGGRGYIAMFGQQSVRDLAGWRDPGEYLTVLARGHSDHRFVATSVEHTRSCGRFSCSATTVGRNSRLVAAR